MGKKAAVYGVLLSLALLVSFVETMIPLPIAIPGVKLGLSNIVILFVLYNMGIRDAVIVSVMRIVLAGFLFGNMAGILYSIGGAALSLFVMYLFRKSNWFSVAGISVCGGVAHNIGQSVIAAWVTSFKTIMFYVPFLLISGVVTGFIIGIVGKEMITRVLSKIYKNS